jgi:hypothetical protein
LNSVAIPTIVGESMLRFDSPLAARLLLRA